MGDVGTGRPLRINGEPVFVASTTEDLPLATVLDRAEAGCKEHSAGIAGELAALPKALEAKIPPGAQASACSASSAAIAASSACLVREDGRVSTGMQGRWPASPP